MVVQKLDSGGCSSTGSAVICAAPAEGEDDFPASVFRCMKHQLADAVSGRLVGMKLAAYQRQAGAGRHFNHRGFSPVDNAVKAPHFFSVGALHRYLYFFSFHSGQKSIHAAFAAVRHRNGNRLRLRIMPVNGPTHDVADFF